ncbi:Gfo/Idh/MocA family protein [Bacteroidota bacterium]
MKRRDILLGLGAIPLITTIGRGNNSEKELNESPGGINTSLNKTIRLGVIGFGFRGEQLARAMKLAHPDWIEKQEKAVLDDSRNKTLEDFNNLNDLNIELKAVCDVFDIRIERGIKTAGKDTTGYKNYKELLNRDDIDAVIIATPDHWHAQMTKDAAQAGKHVYLEKCMTRTAQEAVELRNMIKKLNIIFQLGHQGRQNDVIQKARELVKNGTLGKTTLIETTTNRNNPFAAWVWPIHEKASEKNINWELFQGPAAKKIPFSKERFFRWRCWWEYGTGMAGDLLTHEYDTVNSILNLGIPHSVIASGGIYYYNDGREVPDVFHANFEYPDKELTFVYSGTLSNSVQRGTMIMGHDATIELGRGLTVWADDQSTKYRSRIKSGIIDPSTPIVKYSADLANVDAMTSATSKYFADRGLMYTYQNGKRVDTTHLHIAEWLDCIRKNTPTSCNIEQGFQEAITAHMATTSFREGRKVYWDPEKEKIV